MEGVFVLVLFALRSSTLGSSDCAPCAATSMDPNHVAP